LTHERFDQSVRACIEGGIRVLQARLDNCTLYAEPVEMFDDDQDFGFDLDYVLADLANNTMNANLPSLSWMFNELCVNGGKGQVYIYLDVTVPVNSSFAKPIPPSEKFPFNLREMLLMCTGIEASVPIPYFSINVINSLSVKYPGGDVSFSTNSAVLTLNFVPFLKLSNGASFSPIACQVIIAVKPGSINRLDVIENSSPATVNLKFSVYRILLG
jgi:hypothetical protein